ncbi:hypothetical protein PG994_007887 [Apiospora phragmitis]|uniref:Stc1 domain-containing protein n=1 Tax=Apiospora phragmitis TaxID=2905665 RepID=A0ABR1UTW9_9PEZI
MARGATYVPKPPAKRPKARKSTGPADQPGQSQTQATNISFTRISLMEAERVCQDKFACWSCLTLKHFFEFEAEQATMIRRMDLPGCPRDTLRRVCIECGINIGLYRSGHVLNRNQGSACWVCDCPRAHQKNDNQAGCGSCGMAQPYSTPITTQNEIAPIYSLRQGKRFATVPDLDAPPAQARKTSIPYPLCPTSTPVLLSPPYQHSELANYPNFMEPEEGVWSSGQ